MKVRENYTIRTSLSKKKLDMEIVFNPASGSGTVLNKPITLRVIGLYFIVIASYFGLLTGTFIVGGGLWGILLFTIGYVWLSYLLFSMTDTFEFKFTQIPTLMSYVFDKSTRDIGGNITDILGPMRDLYGIDHVDSKGVIYFTNNELGQLYEVTGYASNLVFESDRNNIIDSASTFFKNLPISGSITIDTVTRPQDVSSQLMVKQYQLDHLKVQSNGLRNIIKMQGRVLRDGVGKKYIIIHQYILVRGTEEDLDSVDSKIERAVRSDSNLFLKKCRAFSSDKEVFEYYSKTLGGY